MVGVEEFNTGKITDEDFSVFSFIFLYAKKYLTLVKLQRVQLLKANAEGD